MGMYSFFEYEDIEVKDWDGLKLFLQKWKEHYPKSWISTHGNMIQTIEEDGKEKEIFTFENWNDIKLISYWYNEQLLFLELVAPYIEGRVEWNFESKDEAGSINFNDNKCEIETGHMDWHTWDPRDNMSKERDVSSNNYNYYDIPEELFKLKLASFMDK